jgi:hypothetical protein
MCGSACLLAPRRSVVGRTEEGKEELAREKRQANHEMQQAIQASIKYECTLCREQVCTAFAHTSTRVLALCSHHYPFAEIVHAVLQGSEEEGCCR